MRDKREILKLITKNLSFEDMTNDEQNHYCKDEDVMLLLFTISSHNIEYADKQLFDNKEFVKKCVRENIDDTLLEYISDSLLLDKDFIDYAITINPRIIVNSPFVEDLELVIDLINQDGGLFKMLPEHISEKREIVLAALECVEEWSDFLEGLSTTYLGNKEFVTEYLCEAYDILNYITNDLRGDKDLVIQILNSNPNNHCLSDIKESLHNDFDVISALVSSNHEEFESVPNEFKNNVSIVVQWVKENIDVLHYVDEEMKLSEEFVSQIRNFPEFEQNADSFPEVVMAIKAYDREKELVSVLEEKSMKKSLKNKKKV